MSAVSTVAVARTGLLKLAPGVRLGHAASYLWAAFVIMGLFSYITALQPYLLSVNLNIPPEQRGVISGNLMMWQEVIALPFIAFFGAYSDRVGRRGICVAGFLFLAASYAAYPFAHSYSELLAYRLAFAVGLGLLSGMLQVIVADYALEQDRGKLVGISVFLNTIGILFFLSVLNRLPSQFQGMGWSALWAGRGAYLVVAGICVLSAVAALALRGGRPERALKELTVRKLMQEGLSAGRRPRIALAYASGFMARADLAIVSLFLSLWAQNSGQAEGLSAAEAARQLGVLFAIIQVSALLWSPVFGWLADRLNRVTLVISAIVLSIAGYGWVGLLPHPLHYSAYPAAALLGIAQTSGLLAPQVLIGQEAPGSIRGSVVGMLVFFGAVGILVISKAGGIAFDAWMPGAPFLIMAMANLGLLVFAFYVRTKAPGPTPGGLG